MSETFEFSVDEQVSSNAVNGLVCAFALLVQRAFAMLKSYKTHLIDTLMASARPKSV